jgi:hypothetical protein
MVSIAFLEPPCGVGLITGAGKGSKLLSQEQLSCACFGCSIGLMLECGSLPISLNSTGDGLLSFSTLQWCTALC